MLIIFALAALALVGVIAVVVVLPFMIVVYSVRANRRRSSQLAGITPDPDSVFLDIVNQEWPQDADPRLA